MGSPCFAVLFLVCMCASGLPAEDPHSPVVGPPPPPSPVPAEEAPFEDAAAGGGAGAEDHQYIFVVGAHHSGTSLMNLLLQMHPLVSGLENTHVAENEGQHVQTVYSAAKKIGGMLRYAFHPDAYMDEGHALVTEENREKLFREWGRFWNLSRPFLVEKSPRHTVMTRFLQAMFGPARSHFMVVMRHPLGATHFRWQSSATRDKFDCGREMVEHWLRIYEALAKDVAQLQSVFIFQFETFLLNNPQTQLDTMFESFGLDPVVEMTISTAALVSSGKRKSDQDRERQRAKSGEWDKASDGGEKRQEDSHEAKNHTSNERRAESPRPRRPPRIQPALLNILYDLGLSKERYEAFLASDDWAKHAKYNIDSHKGDGNDSADRQDNNGTDGADDERANANANKHRNGERRNRLGDADDQGDDDDQGASIEIRKASRNMPLPRNRKARIAGTDDRELDSFEGLLFAEDDESDPKQRRRLKMFHGARQQITVHVGSEMAWVSEWQERVNMTTAMCQAMITDLEPRLNKFGYSLVNLTAILPPQSLTLGKSGS